MGARGPKPRHPRLNTLEGNPRKGGSQRIALPASGSIGEPPKELDKEGKDCWWEVVGSLPDWFYTQADRKALTSFCQAWSRWVEAGERLKVQGLVIVSNNGTYQNPWLSIQNKQTELMIKLSDKLGLTPAARITLRVEREKTQSKFQGLTSIQDVRIAS